MKALSKEQQIDAVIESLGGVSKASPAPYLLTRINARLGKDADNSFWGRAGAFISRPAVAGFGLGVFMLVNCIAVTVLKNGNGKSVASQPGNTNYEFAINVSSNYDIDNQEP